MLLMMMMHPVGLRFNCLVSWPTSASRTTQGGGDIVDLPRGIDQQMDETEGVLQGLHQRQVWTEAGRYSSSVVGGIDR